MMATLGKLFVGGLLVWMVAPFVSPQPVPTDPRYAQIVQCEVAIKSRLADPSSAQMPNFLLKPGAFTRSENNAFEPIETFDFTAKNEYGAMTQRGAYCAYGLDGRLAAADIE